MVWNKSNANYTLGMILLLYFQSIIIDWKLPTFLNLIKLHCSKLVVLFRSITIFSYLLPFYLPHKHANTFTRLAKIFRKHNTAIRTASFFSWKKTHLRRVLAFFTFHENQIWRYQRLRCQHSQSRWTRCVFCLLNVAYLKRKTCFVAP